MSKRDWIEAGVSLVGGAGIGAALMYIFDPEVGERRRHKARSAADDALAMAGDRLAGTWHTLSDRADDVAHSLSASAGRLASSAHNLASSARENVGGYVDTAGERASAYGRGASKAARGYAKSAERTARGWMGSEEHPYRTAAEIVAGSIGALALGAGVMFLLDPAQGRRRRAILRDKAIHTAKETSRYVEGKTHHLSNKAKGAVAKAEHMMSGTHTEKTSGSEAM